VERLFSLLLIAGAIHGFMFNAFTFFYKKKFTKVILFLNLTVFFISLNNLQAWLGDNGYYFNSFFYQKFLVPWYMLILPMFYAFLVHYLKIQTKLNSFVGISLGVFFLEVILRFGLIQYVLNSNYNADDLIARYTAVEEVLNAIFGLFIFIKSSYLVFKQTDLFDFILGYDDIRWLRIFLRLGAIVFLFWVFAIVLFNITGSEEAYQPLRLSTSILLYWIGYQGFYRYHIVEDRIFLRTQITSTRSLKVAQKTSGEVKNSASEKYADEFQKIDGYVLSNQRFLDPKISMELLSEELNISTSHFSKVVNSVSKQNFSDYINSYRVEQSKKLLADPAFENYTIVAIGLECGFNSKSTFYTAFKKFTSQTPTEFRSQNL
jgi:AraC-like DNA-binding protein